MYSYSQPGTVWGNLYGNVAQPAINAGPTPAQYSNNLQQYYGANLGLLQPSLAALVQQQYRNLGHGRTPLANQNAALQMMQMAYNPAVTSAANTEQYARGLLSNAATTAMQYPRSDQNYSQGYGSGDGGRSTYYNPMGGEYRNSGGFSSPSTDTSGQPGSGSYTAIQDTTRPGGNMVSGAYSTGGNPNMGNSYSGGNMYGGLWKDGSYLGGANKSYTDAYGTPQNNLPPTQSGQPTQYISGQPTQYGS